MKPIIVITMCGPISESQEKYFEKFKELVKQDYYLLLFYSHLATPKVEVFSADSIEPVEIEELTRKLL